MPSLLQWLRDNNSAALYKEPTENELALYVELEKLEAGKLVLKCLIISIL